MTLLYLTADHVGMETGGGSVTAQEYQALRELGETKLVSRVQMEREVEGLEEPWRWDRTAVFQFGNAIKLAHIYAGTFSECVRKLKENGARVTYTAAAHSIEISRREHEALGIPYSFPHLTEPQQWERYLNGYAKADVLICPSHYSANVMRGFGCTNRIEVIPHGVHIPEQPIVPPPKGFNVGYLGAVGPDKGLRYLLEAWKKLNYKDSLLIIGGRDSTSSFMRAMIERFGGGNIHCAGWYGSISHFYNAISVYCQPSASEGFGLEVLEAMAFGRQALCSRNAGAVDCVPAEWEVPACNADALAEAIDAVKKQGWEGWKTNGEAGREFAREFSWDRVRTAYQDVWRGLL